MLNAAERLLDVAVVGAGPAGAATARWLQQRGVQVALLERTRFDAPRIGESLAPAVQEPLRRLGLWQQFNALKPLPSWGTRSLWGSAEPDSHSHMSSPHGCGWHVDRRAFDKMLAQAAADAGAVVFEGMTLRQSVWRDQHWLLHVTPTGTRAAPQRLRARVLVDATGRSAQVARALGAQRVVFDRLVGVAQRWVGSDARERGHLLVEAVTDGWWYSAPLPSDVSHHDPRAMLAMLMTDADLWSAQQPSAIDHLLEHSAGANLTRARLAGAARSGTPKLHCARSQRLLRGGLWHTAHWLSVGDAALAVDPISGSGVLRALRTASAAADTVFDLLERPHEWREQLCAYETDRNRECTAYLWERAQFYAAEPRFETEFWRRRHVLQRLTRAAEVRASSGSSSRLPPVDNDRDAAALRSG